jgi:hypothetical protein
MASAKNDMTELSAGPLSSEFCAVYVHCLIRNCNHQDRFEAHATQRATVIYQSISRTFRTSTDLAVFASLFETVGNLTYVQFSRAVEAYIR